MTDALFDELIKLAKEFKNPNQVKLPMENEKKVFPLLSSDSNHDFFVDYHRSGTIELKSKTQMRDGKSIPLVRLEINAPPHMNPDGTLTSRDHIHIYKEGYDLKWAYELPAIFNQTIVLNNHLELFTTFCKYCNIDINNISLQGVV